MPQRSPLVAPRTPVVLTLGLALSASAAAQLDAVWTDAVPSTPAGYLESLGAAAAPGGGLVTVASSAPGPFAVPDTLALTCRDENGDRFWTTDLPLTPQNYTGLLYTEVFGAVAVDGAGGVTLATSRASGLDVRAFDPGGQPGWTTSVAAGIGPHIFAFDARFLASGELLVAAFENEFLVPQSTRQVSLLFIDPATGALLRRVDRTVHDVGGIGVTAAGELRLLASHPWRVERFDPQGVYVASDPLDPPPGAWYPVAFEVDAAGRSVTALNLNSGVGTVAAHIVSLAPGGAPEWRIDLPGEYVSDAALLPDGSLARVSAAAGLPLERVDRSGAPTSATPTPTPASYYRTVAALPDSAVVVTGHEPGPPGPYGSFVAVVDAAGQPVGSVDPTPNAQTWPAATRVALDPRGNPLVALSLGSTQSLGGGVVALKLVRGGDPGVPYCGPAAPNSTGAAATCRGAGADVLAANNLTLLFEDLPPGAPVLALTSRQPGLVPGAGGSQGTLCLGGAIGRYVAPGQVRRATAAGAASLQLHLGALPTPTGSVGAIVGETWRFQGWYRDANPAATSNFTGATAVTIR